MDRMHTVDVLRTQGIMAKGYGIIPQIIARDERLTPEAKAIYCYFSSFAGAGFEPVFPTRNLMLKELNMAKDRYYRHLKILIDCNYITVERCKIGNIYSKNIYTLVQLPNAEEPVLEGKENVHVKRPASVKRRLTERKEHSVNEPRTAEKKTEKKSSAVPESQDEKKHGSAGNVLRAQLSIDSLLEKRPECRSLILDILMVIEDMEQSEQVTVGGSVKKKSAIKQLIGNLRMVHIETLINNISGSGQKIRNKKAYIQSCIGNVLLDVTAPLDFSSKPIKQHDEASDDDVIQARNEEYLRVPELKEIDQQISDIGLKISKAILSGNEIQTKSLKQEKDRLEDRRDKMVLGMNASL